MEKDREKLLKVRDVSVHYGGVVALDKASIQIDDGELVGLIGSNGAGKSTILKSIFGLTPIKSGEIFWHEKPINPKPYELVQMGIAFVPQGRRVFTHLTVLENLEMGAVVIKSKKELKRRADRILETFPELKPKIKEKSGNLSGGQQQMLALARGLMVEPKVLLLDEPSLGLSPKIMKDMFLTIKRINQNHKTAILVVEHNLQSLFQIVSRVYVMDKGKILMEGGSQEVVKSGVLKKIFLGEK